MHSPAQLTRARCLLRAHAACAQFVVQDSAGLSLAEVSAGAEWPPRLARDAAARYAALAARNVSFNAGPCEYARYIYGGGAEFRGVQRDEARAQRQRERAPRTRARSFAALPHSGEQRVCAQR